MAAYAPTNTVILTESASNIRRLIAILESIDIETYKEELAVIRSSTRTPPPSPSRSRRSTAPR